MISSGLKAVLGMACFAACIGASANDARAEEIWRYFSVQVVADDFKVGNRPWDGTSAGFIAGPILLPGFTSPPDLAACVVTVTTSECYFSKRQGKTESYCYDSLNCEWIVRVPDKTNFGIVIYDLDTAINVSLSDLVDEFIVVNGGDEQLTVLEDNVKSFVAEISLTNFKFGSNRKLTFARGEERRRARALLTRSLEDCVSPCRLSQSNIVITPTSGP